MGVLCCESESSSEGVNDAIKAVSLVGFQSAHFTWQSFPSCSDIRRAQRVGLRPAGTGWERALPLSRFSLSKSSPRYPLILSPGRGKSLYGLTYDHDKAGASNTTTSHFSFPHLLGNPEMLGLPDTCYLELQQSMWRSWNMYTPVSVQCYQRLLVWALV